jgi:hypothetical protein
MRQVNEGEASVRTTGIDTRVACPRVWVGVVRRPRPAGVVPVRIRGGASHLRIRRPAGIPVRLRVGHGMADLRFDQQQWARSAVGCGWPPPGDHPGPDRYEIEIASGAAHLEISAEEGGNRSRPTIQAVGLRKRFGKTTALDGLDLILSSGQVLAVLGATTMI